MRQRLAACIATCFLTVSAAASAQASPSAPTATPIKHLVVIFQENVSFDHYFGTYPNAVNTPGEPQFYASPFTPKVNGLTQALLTNNPNKANTGNGMGAVNPFRFTRKQAATADQGHNYAAEQLAFNNGAMDLFPQYTGSGEILLGAPVNQDGTGQVMGYFDGNTVTAMWNYAQNFALNDNSFGTTFGPSTPGAINLVSGQTNGVVETLNGTAGEVDDGHGGLTLISDVDPINDVCSSPAGAQARMGGRNIGDLLNAKGVSWGFFEGGFDLSRYNSNGTTGCLRSSVSLAAIAVTVSAVEKADYIPHHQPFQYYASTANPTHARPASVAMIGHAGDAANHQYDIHDFYDAARAGNMPAVSFLKAPGYQDGHAGYSDPLDEQQFVVQIINFLQSQPDWDNTAVVIAYDDSDGWYDHQASPRLNASYTAQDGINGAARCDARDTLPGVNPTTLHANGRCGYGPRLPLLVISPWARSNMVDHTLTDQSSITRFVEDNWLAGERLGGGSFDAVAGPLNNMFDFTMPFVAGRRLILDEHTGEPVSSGSAMHAAVTH